MNKWLTTTGLLLAVALFLAINIASTAALKSARIDVTENALYTLSQGTKNILQNLEEPITLRFYLSQKLATSRPGISSYTIRVKELLEEYERLAAGKIQLRIIDPEPFSEEEDRAEGFGLQGVPVDQSNTTFYFGLAGTNTTDDEEVIPFFAPNRAEFLEYDVTKLIYQLDKPQQKIIGVMSTLPIQGDTQASPFAQNKAEPWMIMEHLRQLFELQTLETDIDSIPETIDVLMLVHPKGLSDKTLYAIDQFVLNGGRTIVFVDPYSEAEQPPSDPRNPLASLQAPRNSDLAPLFKAWGLELVANKAVGDLEAAQKVQMRKGSGAVVINYPVWVNLDEPRYFNQNDIVTGKLGSMVLATAGSLQKQGNVNTQVEPLIQTGQQAMAIDTQKLGLLSDPENLAREFKPEKQFNLAVRVTGKVKSAFPDGKPKDDEASEETEAQTAAEDNNHLTESTESINVIVVADTDLLQDQFWVNVQNFLGRRIALPHAANATFVSNALENLGGSNDLISVRSRGEFSRPFTRVEDLQQQAEQRFREKEKELLARLQETEQKIRELQNQKQETDALVLSLEQQQEIERFISLEHGSKEQVATANALGERVLSGLGKEIEEAVCKKLKGLPGTTEALYREYREWAEGSLWELPVGCLENYPYRCFCLADDGALSVFECGVSKIQGAIGDVLTALVEELTIEGLKVSSIEAISYSIFMAMEPGHLCRYDGFEKMRDADGQAVLTWLKCVDPDMLSEIIYWNGSEEGAQATVCALRDIAFAQHDEQARIWRVVGKQRRGNKAEQREYLKRIRGSASRCEPGELRDFALQACRLLEGATTRELIDKLPDDARFERLPGELALVDTGLAVDGLSDYYNHINEMAMNSEDVAFVPLQGDSTVIIELLIRITMCERLLIALGALLDTATDLSEKKAA